MGDFAKSNLRVLSHVSLILIVWLSCCTVSMAQKNSIGLHGGLVNFDRGEQGFTYEASLERELIKNLSIGFALGSTGSNNFPDFFQFQQQSINGVPTAVDQYIRGLDPSEALLLGWTSRDETYAQFYLKYQLPFRFSGFQLDIATGLSYVDSKVVDFTLSSFIFNTSTGEITEYEPKFNFGHRDYLGWLLAAGVSRPITEKFTFHANAKLNLGAPSVDSSAIATLYRLGVSMKF